MTMSVERSIEFCYKLLAALWIAGALSLGYTLLTDDSGAESTIIDCHVGKG